MIRVLQPTSPLYVNPLPQLRSRQCLFPSMVELEGGTLLAAFSIGEALESVDSLTHVSASTDGGRTWSLPRPIFPEFQKIPRSDSLKLTALGGGRVAALGYAFNRPDPSLPLGNPENGGMLDDLMLWSLSEDGGRNFAPFKEIPCAWGPHVEASAPVTVLQDGSWISPIAPFPDWNGKIHGRNCGRVLRSYNRGESWNDDVVCMAFPGDGVTCYEQRLCQLASGAILVIGWNEALGGGRLMENHYTVSLDNGLSFSDPMPTGVRGQTASVCALEGERLLSLHSLRRDTERPGIYACLIDFSDRTWKVLEQTLVWEPDTPVRRNDQVAEIFAYLKFGQPGAMRLRNGDVMMTHWAVEEGQYRCFVTRLRVG